MFDVKIQSKIWKNWRLTTKGRPGRSQEDSQKVNILNEPTRICGEQENENKSIV